MTKRWSHLLESRLLSEDGWLTNFLHKSGLLGLYHFCNLGWLLLSLNLIFTFLSNHILIKTLTCQIKVWAVSSVNVDWIGVWQWITCLWTILCHFHWAWLMASNHLFNSWWVSRTTILCQWSRQYFYWLTWKIFLKLWWWFLISRWVRFCSNAWHPFWISKFRIDLILSIILICFLINLCFLKIRNHSVQLHITFYRRFLLELLIFPNLLNKTL